MKKCLKYHEYIIFIELWYGKRSYFTVISVILGHIGLALFAYEKLWMYFFSTNDFTFFEVSHLSNVLLCPAFFRFPTIALQMSCLLKYECPAKPPKMSCIFLKCPNVSLKRSCGHYERSLCEIYLCPPYPPRPAAGLTRFNTPHTLFLSIIMNFVI